MSTARILIVGDDGVLGRDLSLHLERAGYAAAGVASCGAEAVARAGQLQPELMLVDYDIGGDMDSVTVARHIRESHGIPVVFITASTEAAVLRRAAAADPYGYLIKPLSERDVRPTIEVALQRHRAEAGLRRSESRFRRLFHCVRDAVLLIDESTGKVVEANDAAAKLFARPRPSLVGLAQESLYPPSHARCLVDLLAAQAESSTAGPIEAEVLTAEGRLVPVEIDADVFEVDADRKGWLGVFRDIGGRRSTERTLRERQARIDAVFRTAPAGIGMLVDGVLTEINRTMCEMSGYTEDELLGKSFRLLFASQEEFDRVGRDKHQAIETHGAGSTETHWQCKDGSCIDVLLNFTRLDPGDPASGITFAAVDITERKRIKAELRQRNRILEGLQRISRALLEVSDGAGAFDQIAAEVAAMLDLRFASVTLDRPATGTVRLVGLHGFDLSPSVPREVPIRQSLAGLVLERCAPVVEYDVRRLKDRLPLGLKELPVAFFAGVPMMADGRANGVLAVAHDHPRPVDSFLLVQLSAIANHIATLVERREAEAARRAGETELHAICNHVPVMICLLDEDNRIVRVNQTAARFAGRRPADLHGAKAGEFLSCLGALADSRGCGCGSDCTSCTIRNTVTDTLRNGRTHIQVGVSKQVGNHAGRPDLHLLLSTAPIDLAGNRRTLVVLEDITENRRLNEHLMRAQRMESIGTLASGIAHDLNNVLAPIVMCLSMLRETTVDPHILESIETMQVAARRGAEIVRQVLTFARGHGGEHVEIQPKHIVQETARIARETFPRSIEVTSDFVREPRTFLGDPTQIQQVLMNLCVNARDAMPTGGKLRIGVENTAILPPDTIPVPASRAGGFIAITVEDTGCGMSPEVVKRIFDPYFSTKPPGKGTGLGLAVSLGIVERHGGCIQVESTPGSGTTIRIFLPVATGKPLPPPVPLVDEPELRGHGETILLVDDEPSARSILSGMLDRAGYSTLVTHEGSEALKRLGDPGANVRLLVTDLMMPGMDGLDLIRHVRMARPDLLIVAMSGLGEDEIRASATEAGADQVIPKPFTHRILLRVLSDLLRQQGN